MSTVGWVVDPPISATRTQPVFRFVKKVRGSSPAGRRVDDISRPAAACLARRRLGHPLHQIADAVSYTSPGGVPVAVQRTCTFSASPTFDFLPVVPARQKCLQLTPAHFLDSRASFPRRRRGSVQAESGPWRGRLSRDPGVAGEAQANRGSEAPRVGKMLVRKTRNSTCAGGLLSAPAGRRA